MTDFGSSRTDQEVTGTTYRREPATSGWAGWVRFAAFLMILNGALQAMQGFAALVNPDYYRVTSSGLAVSIDYSAWGWIHLAVGVALFASGMGVLAGNLLARIVGIVFVGLNALTTLAFIEAAPGWGIIMITLDVVVIYSLTVHGSEVRDL